MRINEIILNELKEYIDPNSYGAWINIDGTVVDVPNDYAHHMWLENTYGENSTNADPFSDGWVRVAAIYSHASNSLNIQGHFIDVKKTFKKWWPSVITKREVIIGNESEIVALRYKIPEEKNKLLKDFGPSNENK